MSDRTQRLCDLSLYPCNNAISFASPGTRACGLGLLWAWMVHEVFASLAYRGGRSLMITVSNLLPQQF